jgi:hypothetical protein
MPKPHYTTASAGTQAQLAGWLNDCSLETPNGSMPVRAAGILRWVQQIYQRGYDILPSEVPTPAHDAIAAIKGDPAAQGRLRTQLGAELQLERRAVAMAEGRRKWAAEPSEAELAEQRRIEREKAAADAALEQRTTEIVNAVEAERLEKLKAAARKQAAKEIANV